MGLANMPPAMHAGLKTWAKGRKTSTIAEHLAGKVDDPKAVAVAVRKDAIGAEQFKRNQAKARRSKCCG